MTKEKIKFGNEHLYMLRPLVRLLHEVPLLISAVAFNTMGYSSGRVTTVRGLVVRHEVILKSALNSI